MPPFFRVQLVLQEQCQQESLRNDFLDPDSLCLEGLRLLLNGSALNDIHLEQTRAC